jgi:hypothetical protein
MEMLEEIMETLGAQEAAVQVELVLMEVKQTVALVFKIQF